MTLGRRVRHAGSGGLNVAAQRAIGTLKKRMGAHAPTMAKPTLRWMHALSGRGANHEYFLSGWGYPVLELPWQLARVLGKRSNTAFGRDLVYSTICGYYVIRLFDDLLDADSNTGGAPLLMAPWLQCEFQAPYVRHLASSSGFWKASSTYWAECLEATERDGQLASVDFETFVGVSAKKTAAAKIPVAAMFARYSTLAAAKPWLRFCDDLGRFVQMADDLFDWPTDFERGESSTYFLSEGRRRRRRRETTAAWVRREGLDWATELCCSWLDDLESQARKLDSVPVHGLLRERRNRLLHRVHAMQKLLTRTSRRQHPA